MASSVSSAGSVKWSMSIDSWEIVKSATKPFAVFVISIHVSTETVTAKRRYSSFKALYENLVHMFPRISVPPVPSSKIGRSFEESYLRGMMTALDTWLHELVAIDQLGNSSTFFSFLEGDDTDKRLDSSRTAVGLLLCATLPQKETVKSGSEFSCDVEVAGPGCVVVWEFTTVANDIAFFVEFEGQTVVPHARFRSHEKEVQGSYTCAKAGTVRLCWDNSYSRWKTKKLTFRAECVDAAAAAAAASAEEAAKAKLRSQHSVVALLRPNTVGAVVEQIGDGMVARSQRDQALEMLQAAEDKIASLTNEASARTMRLQRLEEQLAEMTGKYTRASEELVSTKEALAVSEDAVSLLKQENHAAVLAKRDAEARHEQAVQASEALRKQRDAAELKLEMNAQAVANAQKERESHSAAAAAAASRIATLESQLSMMKDGSLIAQLEASIAELKVKLAEAEQNGAKARKAAAKVVKAKKVLEEKVAKQKREMKVLVSEIRNARATDTISAAATAAATGKAKEASAAVAAAEERCRCAEVELQKVKAENAELQSRLRAVGSGGEDSVGQGGGSTEHAVKVSEVGSLLERAQAPPANGHKHRSSVTMQVDLDSPSLPQSSPPPDTPSALSTSSKSSSNARDTVSSIGAAIAAAAGKFPDMVRAASLRDVGRSSSQRDMSDVVKIRSWSGSGEDVTKDLPGSQKPTNAIPIGRSRSSRMMAVQESGSLHSDGFPASHSTHSHGSNGSASGHSAVSERSGKGEGTSAAAMMAMAASKSPSRGTPGSRKPMLSPSPSARSRRSMSVTAGSMVTPKRAQTGAAAGLVSHPFWRFDPLFLGGDPAKAKPSDVQVWTYPVLNKVRTIDRQTLTDGANPHTRPTGPLLDVDGSGGPSPAPAAGPVTLDSPSPGMTRRGSYVQPTQVLFVSADDSMDKQGTPEARLKAAFRGVGRVPPTTVTVGAQSPAMKGGATEGKSLWGALKGLVDKADGKAAFPQFNTACRSCGQVPLRFVHWRCAVCPNYVLCHSCYRQGVHMPRGGPGAGSPAPSGHAHSPAMVRSPARSGRRASYHSGSQPRVDGGAAAFGVAASPAGATAL